MRQLIRAFLCLALLSVAGCEKTVREPGEPPHGGVFLHAENPRH